MKGQAGVHDVYIARAQALREEIEGSEKGDGK